ncbi:hypothetical protein C7H19_06290 [Aphanothece hegewaldii CCALA 016]|uniref:Uncharacterized protein n=1 Tax=Aphanothece hegewaldii CCALA 016 TaxID=2107694 RepID=A0A2T1M067_9CHRO|nr:hypothetical protein [Aphanothece hegewaldii]PSF38078.1 hypothetical protein C7H19_06290 [Aphanothece hegewaldii CCALA 016]
MQLIYRGQIFEYHAKINNSLPRRQAINWRYAVPGVMYKAPSLKNQTYHLPKAINWRWLPQE